MAKLIPTPSQTIGPFFHVALERPSWSDLTRDGAAGPKIHIEGRVTDGEGKAVGDALIEIWQANGAGRYAHPEDDQEKPLDPKFRGFGRVFTDKDGRYRFTTIRPGPVPGRGNALQAPHINVTLFARGLLKHLRTRLYFEGDKANNSDPVLSRIEDDAARRSLIAKPGAPDTWIFDIRLQGEGETAFFEV
jgi:protocatechuate 3,4-dioxygenase alpha subunit